MDYPKRFLYSCMENNYLDFRGLHLTNEELEKCSEVFMSLFERTFIQHINLTGNRIKKYNGDKLLKIFPRLQYIYSPEPDAIDVSMTPQLNILAN